MNPQPRLVSVLDAPVIDADNELIRRVTRWQYLHGGGARMVHLVFDLDGSEVYQGRLCRTADRVHTITERGHLFVLKESIPRGVYNKSNGHNLYICQYHGEELIAGWSEDR